MSVSYRYVYWVVGFGIEGAMTFLEASCSSKEKRMKVKPFFRKALLPVVLVFLAWMPLSGECHSGIPSGGHILQGTGKIVNNGGFLEVIQESEVLVIEWDCLDIPEDMTMHCSLPGLDSTIIHRVRGPGVSRISGRLLSNGRVFLVNPYGFVFTVSSDIHARGVTVSTRDIRPENWSVDKEADTDDRPASINLHGAIQTMPGGDITCIAPEIQNSGEMICPNGMLLLISGKVENLPQGMNQWIDTGGNRGVIRNFGWIQADGGTVMLLAGAAMGSSEVLVENTGGIRCQTKKNHMGSILLLADRNIGRLVVGGILDASAPDGGPGGFIETSAAEVSVREDAVVTTRGANGDSGQWLLDPQDFVIAPVGGDMTGTQLSKQLENSNVEIQSASGSAAGNGDVFVNDHITWNANTLTLSAFRNIIVNRELYGSENAKLDLKYGQGSSNGTISGSKASYSVNARVNLPPGATFRTKLGSSGSWRQYTVITQLGLPGSRTGTDLQGMAGNLSRNYALGADIDASVTADWNQGQGFEPISGNSAGLFPVEPAFTGMFDGLGHTIRGLFIRRNINCLGLFGYAKNSIIQNVRLTGGSITGGHFTGGLVGWLQGNSSLHNCANTSPVQTEGSAFSLGGLAGTSRLSDTTIRISNCFNSGAVTGAYLYAGGLVGIANDTLLTNSSNIGTVAGYNVVGGLVGSTNKVDTLFVHCFNAGKVIGNNVTGRLTGGLIAEMEYPYAQVTGSYWDTEISGEITTAPGGGMGLSTTAMMQMDTFYAGGWDICDYGHGMEPLWRIYEGQSYPLLRSFLTPATCLFPGTKVYDGTTEVQAEFFSWLVHAGEIFDSSKVQCTSVRTTGKDVGSYPIDPGGIHSGQTGYDIRFIGTPALDITPAPLLITANEHVKVFDNKPYQGGNGVVCTGLVPGESIHVLEGVLRYEGDSQGAVQPGTYSIIPSGLSSGNYAITFVPGTLTILETTQLFTIQVSADPPAGGTVDGGGEYAVGSLVTVRSVANPGWKFVCWSENGGAVSTEPDYSFLVTGDRSLTAVFIEISGLKPVIRSLEPSETVAGGEEFSLIVEGEGFDDTSLVRWEGSERRTTYVSSGILAAEIPVSDIRSPGQASITVVNQVWEIRMMESDPVLFPIRDALVSVQPIPTLGEWGGILLAFLLLLIVIRRLKTEMASHNI